MKFFSSENGFSKQQKESLKVYALIFLVCLITWLWGILFLQNKPEYRIFGLSGILLVLSGFALVPFQKAAGFPDLLDREVAGRKRFVEPFFIGIAFAIADVIVFKLILHPEPYTSLPPFLQPFPYSLLLFFSGAVYCEVLYRLLPLTLILILISLITRGKGAGRYFWILAVLTSLWEPLEQTGNALPWVMGYTFISGFLFNFLQAVYYRKAGFLSSLSVRQGHYFLWHILLGIYVQHSLMAGKF